MVASGSGEKSLSIQVKASRNSYRAKRYGSEGYEWDVGGGVIGKCHESLWYALVNLQERIDGWNPEVFFVPPLWVGSFVKPTFSRKIYFLPTTAHDITHERWDLLRKYLNSEEAISWANTWPEDKLVRWGDKTS